MDEDQVGALIETIYTSAMEADGWNALLQTLREQFNASQAITLAWDKAIAQPFFIASTIFDPSADSRYESYYHAVDPTYPALLKKSQAVARMRAFSQEEIIDSPAFFRSELYCDFTRHFDMGQSWYAMVDNTEYMFAALHVHRPPAQREFDTAEITLLRALAPHLGRGQRIYREFTGARARAGLFETALDALAATFLLDAAGRVLSLNAKAGDLLDAGSPLTVQAGRLTARHPPDQARLAAALAPLSPGAPPAELILRGASHCPGVRISVTPVNGAGHMPLFFDVTPTARGAFLVSATPLGPTAQSLMAGHGLTRAEAEVALLLAQGLRAPQIAARRETSVGTVNTQLKNIYAKTGVDGHAGLLVKLLGR